ncbi:GH116 family glycosyl-hydrolase [uncultured Paludibaculum sp.]|uniref:GH116 family glycosyl-hydrolase n=1 Tax=uncultured Paludibaculum sp. TaxID=1765020 RepID=UPI002AAC49FA|nr:GH116 family glycosyl-hydrolase [uncultured Paludibaculum sp.]
MQTDRRSFLKIAGATPAALSAQIAAPGSSGGVAWPRKFAGLQLQQIAFPLGGIAAGSISLGGRGQLRDWEIFNRPDKGNAPSYALPAIWAQVGDRQPVAKIAEARYLPPYEGSSGLGSNNMPGMPRMDTAVFTGSYPIAHIDFRDRKLPVRLALDAFTPIFPLDADESGLPVAILRYKVTNPANVAAKVALCYSIDNVADRGDGRTNTEKASGALRGLVMSNPGVAADHELKGDFTLAALGDGEVTIWRGWPKGRWWNSPMLFWDEFSAKGRLENEPDPRNAVGAVSIRKEIPAGGSAEFTFVLAWHFPNRTPARCGWHADKGDEKTLIGNYYSTRFPDSWATAEYLAKQLPMLEKKTRAFVQAMADSTLPGAVKDAAMSNLSTLATTTSFRTSEGEFHGFEGVNDKAGCCHGSCTHVWNYESTTAMVYPTLARSLRNAVFGHMMDERGAIHFRETLPTKGARSGLAAADGQMGQIMKAYLDWRLWGDKAWLAKIYPAVRKSIEFCWIPGGWDADRDGVMEGAQHNTYDVEFYGPNPMCGIYYLGALRAGEELAKAAGDQAFAQECRGLYGRGRKWIEANLFNGEYFIQKVQGTKKDTVAKALISDMGSENTESPEYQMGNGCLVDQLIGQYQSEVCGLGPLVSEEMIKKTLQSIYQYNYKRDMSDHECVQRTYVLNDEAALVVCDYGKGTRPHIPFPYYGEVFTGLEHATASHMIYAGMAAEGMECFVNTRRRYDGQRRNPWDEAECGHHYARAMAAWSGILALSGFVYHAPEKRLILKPQHKLTELKCFWSTASGWGTFELGSAGLTIRVEDGFLDLGSVELAKRTVKLQEPVKILPGQPYKVA